MRNYSILLFLMVPLLSACLAGGGPIGGNGSSEKEYQPEDKSEQTYRRHGNAKHYSDGTIDYKLGNHVISTDGTTCTTLGTQTVCY